MEGNQMKKCMHALGMAVAMALPAATQAQSYPVKPIRLVMSVSGGAEVVVRIASQRWQEVTGQPMVVAMQSGAGGAVGAGLVAKAAPAGSPRLRATASRITIHPHFTQTTPSAPIRPSPPRPLSI